MSKTKKIFAVLLAISLIFAFAACTKSNTDTQSDNTAKKELKNVTLCLDWTPNTNHTGFYVALQQGYYKDAGLNVKIVQPPENGATEACSSGQAQFAIDAQDTIASAFTSDTPMQVTAVAALIQHNTSCIMSKKGEGMDTPKGLVGKTYLTWDSPIELAMMENVVKADGGDWSKVKRIPNTVTDEAQDVEVDKFFFKDLNPTFDYYTPILIANNDLIKNDPETVKAFLSATKKGYEYAIENPEKAAQMLIDGDDTGSLKGSEELVKASQKYMAEQYIADAPKWGYIDPARWNAFYNWLGEAKIVDEKIPENTGFTNDYLA